MRHLVILQCRSGLRVWCNDGTLKYWGFPSDAHVQRFRHLANAQGVARYQHGRVVSEREFARLQR